MKIEDLIAVENLNNIYSTIYALESQRAEILTILDNVKQSISLIDQFGCEALPHLNLDGGLEKLIGSPIEKITVETAKSSLEKLNSNLVDQITDLDYTIGTGYQQLVANEGFWRRLTYNFTSDFKCAAKIDELISKLGSMTPYQENELKSKEIDFRMQPADQIDGLIKFSEAAITWVVHECENLKNNADKWWLGSKVKDQFRSWAKSEAKKFYAKWNINDAANLSAGRTVSGHKVAKKKTYAELGYSKNTILSIAKKFKASASGHLKEVKKVRSIIEHVGTDTHVGAMILANGDGSISPGITIEQTISALVVPILNILNVAIDCYKFVDYFLYYTYKEV